MRWLDLDGRKLLITRSLRTFGYGYLAVILALYLQALGLDAFEIGVVLTAAIAGSAVMTVWWSLIADQYGRRKTVATMALLMVAGGVLVAFSRGLWPLLVAAASGTISATNSEVGVFLTVEQAVLPQTAPDARRTWLYSIYDTLAAVAGAAGALFASTVGVWSRLGLAGADAYRPLFVLYALIGLANFVLFMSLSERVELAHLGGERRLLGVHRSAGTVLRLALLFGLDAFAGGFAVQSLVAYWFHLRFGFSPELLAVLFFWVNVFTAGSLLVAGWLAGRIGLLNTMVFTHLPSNVLLVLVPLMPSAPLAVLVYLARSSLSQMDVPTRKSYTMAVVDPDERTAAAGLTNVARSAAGAISPLLTGVAFSLAALGVPFFLSGGLKIAYDLLMYRTFRHIRPPEEAAALSTTLADPARAGPRTPAPGSG